jgi:hypothetical protein
VWAKICIYLEAIRRAVRQLGLLSLDRLRSLRSLLTQPERLVARGLLFLEQQVFRVALVCEQSSVWDVFFF